MKTKTNVVIAMLCASIMILSVATPISALDLTDSGIGGEVVGDGKATGSVVQSARANSDGTGEVEASISASAEMYGPGSAECSKEGPVTSTLTTPLGEIVADVGEDSEVNAEVEVTGEGSGSSDAYVGTAGYLGASEVEITSEISSDAWVSTDGGSASADASATGTTSGDGTSYATGGAPCDATSHAVVSGDTEANAEASGIAGAGSFAIVGSYDYAGHDMVVEESIIGAGSYAGSKDVDSKASADSVAEGVAIQEGQAENCCTYSETLAEGETSTKVKTEGPGFANADAHIVSFDAAGTDYVHEESSIGAHSHAESDTDGEASAKSSSEGFTDASGGACGCLQSETFAEGETSTDVKTSGPGSANADAYINSYDDVGGDIDTGIAHVHEESHIGAHSHGSSGTGGVTSAKSSSEGYTDASGAACGCLQSETFAEGETSTQVKTSGPGVANADAHINSYDDVVVDIVDIDTGIVHVHEESHIGAHSHGSSKSGETSAKSSSEGLTGASGGACGCLQSETFAEGETSTQVKTSGPGFGIADAYIDSYDDVNINLSTDYGYVNEDSHIGARSEAESGTDGKTSAKSSSEGFTNANGEACGCLYSDTYAEGETSTDVDTSGPGYTWSSTSIRSYSYGEKEIGTDYAYVFEGSYLNAHSYGSSGTGGETSAKSSSEGYTGASGAACGCLYSDTYAEGATDAKTETSGSVPDAGSWAYIGSHDEMSTYYYVHEDSRISAGSRGWSDTGGETSAKSSSEGFAIAIGEDVCTGIFSGAYAEGAAEVKTETVDNAKISAYARLISEGLVIGDNVYVESEIRTGARAWNDSNAEGKATIDCIGSEAIAFNPIGEWAETGILEGEGETVVKPFNEVYTWTFVEDAYAIAHPIINTGSEDIKQKVYIDTSGPIDVYSFTRATASIETP